LQSFPLDGLIIAGGQDLIKVFSDQHMMGLDHIEPIPAGRHRLSDRVAHGRERRQADRSKAQSASRKVACDPAHYFLLMLRGGNLGGWIKVPERWRITE
jgi:hypothetical protein